MKKIPAGKREAMQQRERFVLTLRQQRYSLQEIAEILRISLSNVQYVHEKLQKRKKIGKDFCYAKQQTAVWEKRKAKIALMLDRGMTLEAIGKKVKLTRGRVHQIKKEILREQEEQTRRARCNGTP